MNDQKLKTKTRSSSGMIRAESIFKRSLIAVGIAMVLLVAGLMITLIIESVPSMKNLGLKYLWSKTWDPVNNVYGALPFLIGTLLTSFLALIISIPDRKSTR